MITSTKYLFILLFFAPIIFADDARIESPTTLNFIAPRTEDSILRRVVEAVYKESFKRLGVNISFSSCVPKRCGKYVTDGTADGEMARTIIYEDIYPELIRTEEQIYSIKLSAFSTDTSIKINSWDDLIDSKYKVAYIRGYYIVDKNVTERIGSKNIVYVKHWSEGINKLSSKDVDIYIGVEKTVSEALKGKETSIRNAGILDTQNLYPYFNKKHRLLAEKLAVILKEMKTDGTMEKIFSN